MTEILRVGVLGLSHDHVWNNLADANLAPDVEVTAAADPHAALRQQFQSEYGRPAYASPEELFSRETIDAVLIFADNATSVEYIRLAAQENLPAMVEKPLAHSLQGAEDAISAVVKAGTRLMVNWPFAWWPQLQYAVQLAALGEIGRVWQVKYRAAHAGPEALGCSPFFCEWLFDRDRNGAGAFIDYCCYGALLARVVLGVPSRVYGMASRVVHDQLPVEDNGLLVMSYPKAMATAEGSWTQIGKLTSYQTVIFGTSGTLFVEPRPTGRLLLATATDPEGSPVDVPKLPLERCSAAAHFAHCLRTDEPFLPMCDATMARDAQEMLEAGLCSAASGQEVSLPLRNLVRPAGV